MPEDHDVAGPSAITPGARPPRTWAAMSDELVASLREAFTEEVVDRMPRLCAVRTAVPGRDVVSQARRDAHSLAGSAAVVGEAEAARCARSLELQLEAFLEDLHRPLPATLLTSIDLLESLLASWFEGQDDTRDQQPGLAPVPAAGA